MRPTISNTVAVLRVSYQRASSVIRSALIPTAFPRLYTTSCRNPSPRLSFHDETVDVEVGNSGCITLNILHPILNPPTSPRPDVILYLPPGPLSLPTRASRGIWDRNRDDALPSIQHVLASKTLSTVVTLNYRLGPITHGQSEQEQPRQTKPIGTAGAWPKQAFTFPTPVHDTLAGFDWIFQHIKPNRVCVYGRNIGGSLAIMLGLTEPRSVHAIATEEPVCDWTGLDGYCLPAPEITDDSEGTGNFTTSISSEEEQVTKKKLGRKSKTKEPTNAPVDLVPLLEARRRLFRKPENYFDSFASPVLFLRSAGKDCPTSFPTFLTGPDYLIPVLERSLPERLDMDMEVDPAALPRVVRRRKSLSRWPPYGLDYQMSGERRIVGGGASRAVKITLPWVRLFIHSNNVDPTQDSEQSPTDEDSELARGVEELCLNDARSEEGGSASTPQAKNSRSKRSRKSAGSNLKEETVLAAQGVEMVSLFHGACFFGRERGFGEERVKLVRVPFPDDHSATSEPTDREDEWSATTSESTVPLEISVEERAGKWFHEVLGGTKRMK